MEWLSGIWRGELKVSDRQLLHSSALPVQPLKSSEARPCFATHIKGLRIANLLEFAQSQGLKPFLPVPTRTGKPPKYHRSWLLTVSAADRPSLIIMCAQLCNSKAHDAFKSFKKEAMRTRREERLRKADAEVLTLKEIAEKITQTNMIPGTSIRCL